MLSIGESAGDSGVAEFLCVGGLVWRSVAVADARVRALAGVRARCSRPLRCLPSCMEWPSRRDVRSLENGSRRRFGRQPANCRQRCPASPLIARSRRVQLADRRSSACLPDLATGSTTSSRIVCKDTLTRILASLYFADRWHEPARQTERRRTSPCLKAVDPSTMPRISNPGSLSPLGTGSVYAPFIPELAAARLQENLKLNLPSGLLLTIAAR